MSKNLSLVAIALFAWAIINVSHADPGRLEESREKIRKEYRGSAAPDYLMFAMHIRSIKGTAEWNREIALGIIQKNMHLGSEQDAEAFLSRMIVAAGELDSEHDKVWEETVCRPDAPRSKEDLYQMLDRLDDLTEIKAHNIYVKFMSTLNQGQQEAMTAWLQDAKEGFYYRTAEHKDLFQSTGQNVVEHVNIVCASRRAEQ